MAERLNGKVHYSRRTQGSERRGATPVPDLSYAFREQQSRKDKARLLSSIFRQRELESERLVEEDLGLGNRDLPAFKHKLELVANIEAHKAVIVGGETGSGKSTQLPQYLYEAGYDMTIMLVPRRVIADGLGDRIRDELSSQIEDFNADETVGIIHGERVERHENNKIMVMTPNTFIKMEQDLRKQYGDKKVAVVADEIHEANLFTEIAVGVAALSVSAQDDWRLVAASATLDKNTPRTFQKLNDGYVPLVEIQGRPFNVEFREAPDMTPMRAYARDGADHEKAMIFTSGKKEIEYAIEETRRELEAVERGYSKNVIFRILHGELTETELSHINDPVPEGYRLVIVSSPAGMSGITIPGVTYVATDGTINRAELDDDNAEGLRRHYLSKAGVIQEIGRAGRTVAGGVGVLCAPINTERAGRVNRSLAEQKGKDVMKGMPYIPFDQREEQEPPEIYSTHLARIVLSVAALGYRFADLNEYIPHPVQKLDIINAEEVLARLGALDDDGVVTAIGMGMDKFPVTPELARGLYEASLPGKSLQHMARAAFVAAAVDVGGLQNHRVTDTTIIKTRRQLLRDTTADDFTAQLDFMTKLYERTTEDFSGYEFVDRHGLHPKRVERVRKTTRKILGVMGIRPQNVIVTAPVPDEERQLRDDFTAGFIDYVYEPVGRAPRSQHKIYRNVHGDDESTTRTISDRSEASTHAISDQLVAGIPRWYEKGTRKDGTPIKHDIIDHVFPVSANVVGHYARQNGLVQGVLKESRMIGDRVVDYEQGAFGSISVGVPIERSATEVVSQQSQDLLVSYVLKNKGRVQQGLRQLADELEQYRNWTPADILTNLRKPGVPQDITQQHVTDLIRHYARTTASAHEIEEKLQSYLYSSNLTLGKYYDPESIKLLSEMSPQQIMIGNEYVQVHYEAGQPYVTTVPKRQLLRVMGPIYLKDGREVLHQRQVAGGGKERVSFEAGNIHVGTIRLATPSNS